MKTMLKLSFVMGVYAAVACLALAGVYLLTAPRIAAAENRAVYETLSVIFPDADNFKDVSGSVTSPGGQIVFDGAYVAYTGSEVVGMVIRATGPTYKSSTLLVGVDTKRTLKPVQFMANTDTPGLGTKTAEPAFSGQFTGKAIDDAFSLGDDLDNISGATISSRGVAEIVKIASWSAGDYLAREHGSLAGTGDGPKIVELAPMEAQKALEDIFPGSEFVPIENLANTLERSIVFDRSWLVRSGDTVVGVAIEARGQTYKATTAIVGVTPDRILAGVRITETTDTKNYGWNMNDPAFYGLFTGMSADAPFLVRPTSADGDIDALSGATVSSLGFANIVKVASLEGARYLADNEGGKPAPASAQELVLNVIPDEQ